MHEPEELGRPESRGEADDAGETEGAERPRPSRRTVVLLVTPIVVLFVLSTVATALTPALAARHPLLLIMLEARNRNLVLARRVDLVPFVLVATLRRSLTDPLFYFLGRLFGDRAVRWLENQAGGGSYVRAMETFFSKAAYPMVFMFPGAIVCALAGATGMPLAAFLVVNIAGTVFAVLVLRLFGDVLSAPVDAIVGFFDRNLVVTTSISVGLVVLWLVLARLQGRVEVPSIRSAEEELGLDEEDEGERPSPQA